MVNLVKLVIMVTTTGNNMGNKLGVSRQRRRRRQPRRCSHYTKLFWLGIVTLLATHSKLGSAMVVDGVLDVLDSWSFITRYYRRAMPHTHTAASHNTQHRRSA